MLTPNSQLKLDAYKSGRAFASILGSAYPDLVPELLRLLSKIDPVKFAPDCGSARLYGVDYVFTRQEAAAVAFLKSQSDNGTPWVLSATVLKAIRSDARSLFHVFRRRGGQNSFWSAHIESDGSACRLVLDDPEARTKQRRKHPAAHRR